MDQSSTDVREGTAFARRLIRRTLTVVGGVAAGTALAWWLSTTAAAADVEVPTEHSVPAAVTQVQQVQQLAAPVTGPVEQAATTITKYVQDPPPPPRQALEDLGDTVNAKVKDVAATLRAHTDLPRCAVTVCLDQQQTRDYPADPFGRMAMPTAQAPTTVAVPLTVTTADLDAIAHRTAKDRALADGMSRRGSPEPAAPALPDLPTWPTPFAPAPQGVPVSGGHGASGSSFDSQHLAVLPWYSRATQLVACGLSADVDAATFGRPGNQPGVAPD